jgi:nucleoside phosphorylase
MASELAVDLLIVSAHLPELAGLRPLLGDGLYGSVAGLVVAARAAGIGVAAAGAGAAAHIGQLRPRAVLLVGTCGAYLPAGLGIDDVVLARRVHLVSVSVTEGRGIFPAPMPVSIEAHAGLGQALATASPARLRAVDVATTLAITTDDALAGRMAVAHDCQVEHLEAFAVAEACALLAVPFAAVLGVANQVGTAAHEQWRMHHRSAGAAAVSSVAAWLAAGAPGLPARVARID